MASSASVPTSRRTAVYLELGPRRSFACAVDWPGWCRVARGDGATALELLAAYAPRYARVAERAGETLPRIGPRDFDVVETVPGSAITDFGAPDVVPDIDLRPVAPTTARRDVALLRAAWAELDAVVAAAPASLRKGPRGGGRDRDAMFDHVVEAERSYARKIGVRLTAAEWRAGHVALMRARIGEALAVGWAGGAPAERAWPPRYVTRRTAWHALDHAWEIEDRSAP